MSFATAFCLKSGSYRFSTAFAGTVQTVVAPRESGGASSRHPAYHARRAHATTPSACRMSFQKYQLYFLYSKPMFTNKGDDDVTTQTTPRDGVFIPYAEVFGTENVPNWVTPKWLSEKLGIDRAMIYAAIHAGTVEYMVAGDEEAKRPAAYMVNADEAVRRFGYRKFINDKKGELV